MPARWMVPLLAALALPVSAAQGNDIANFYKGRQINLIVGSGTGGGYDAYARVLARHIGRHIPGNPSIVVQNMPGAGGLRAANYLYNVAPKDGTTIAVIAHDLALHSHLGHNPNIQFDFQKFIWLGSSSSFADDAYLLIARPDAVVKSVEDARRPGRPPLLVAASTGGAGTGDTTTLIREALGFNLKPVTGYRGSSDMFLAIDRKEADGRFTALSVLQATRPAWLKPGAMRVLFQFARATRHPLLPEVPTARELAQSDIARALIELAEIPYFIDRPFAAPPGLPADRAKALQDAFVATHQDARYLDEARKLMIDVSPVDAEGVRRAIERIQAAPAAALDHMRKLLANRGSE
jgi:tripartite-type tricarboxylate transporter receptor subunit TctC